MPGTYSSGLKSGLVPVAATELVVLLNPFTIMESGGADIEDKRVGSPDML